MFVVLHSNRSYFVSCVKNELNSMSGSRLVHAQAIKITLIGSSNFGFSIIHSSLKITELRFEQNVETFTKFFLVHW